MPSAVKIDLFILRPAPFDQSEFGRRRRIELDPGHSLWIKSPEDSILRKLLWFRDAGGQTERQWRDVVEILRVSGPVLEDAYLDAWAPKLGLEALLAKARDEASRGGWPRLA